MYWQVVWSVEPSTARYSAGEVRQEGEEAFLLTTELVLLSTSAPNTYVRYAT